MVTHWARHESPGGLYRVCMCCRLCGIESENIKITFKNMHKLYRTSPNPLHTWYPVSRWFLGVTRDSEPHEKDHTAVGDGRPKGLSRPHPLAARSPSTWVIFSGSFFYLSLRSDHLLASNELPPTRRTNERTGVARKNKSKNHLTADRRRASSVGFALGTIVDDLKHSADPTIRPESRSPKAAEPHSRASPFGAVSGAPAWAHHDALAATLQLHRRSAVLAAPAPCVRVRALVGGVWQALLTTPPPPVARRFLHHKRALVFGQMGERAPGTSPTGTCTTEMERYTNQKPGQRVCVLVCVGVW